MATERPLADVPKAVVAVLMIALTLQLAGKALQEAPLAQASDLDRAPSRATLQLASFGDPSPMGSKSPCGRRTFRLWSM